MSNTQQPPDPIVFVPTSISEKPPQSHRRYLLIGNVGGGHVMAFGAATDNGEWFFESGDDRKVRITDAFTHWLKPTPLSSLLKDKQKRIEELEAEVIRRTDLLKKSRNICECAICKAEWERYKKENNIQ